MPSAAAAAEADERPVQSQVGMLLGGALICGGIGLMLLQFTRSKKQQQQRATRQKAIADADIDMRGTPDADTGIVIDKTDIEAAENEGTVKVHVELPDGEIISFRVKKRRLGSAYDELCNVILQGVPEGSLTLDQMHAMEMQYEDKDGDMVVLGRSSDVAALVSDAQAIFVSRRVKAAGTRIAAGPGRITGTPDLSKAAQALGK